MSRIPRIADRLSAAPARIPSPAAAPTYGRGRGGRPWRRLRDQVLKRDGYECQPCKRMRRATLAREVDHIVPLFQGGGEGDENLQAICKDCHDAKTQREARQGRGIG